MSVSERTNLHSLTLAATSGSKVQKTKGDWYYVNEARWLALVLFRDFRKGRNFNGKGRR